MLKDHKHKINEANSCLKSQSYTHKGWHYPLCLFLLFYIDVHHTSAQQFDNSLYDYVKLDTIYTIDGVITNQGKIAKSGQHLYFISSSDKELSFVSFNQQTSKIETIQAITDFEISPLDIDHFVTNGKNWCIKSGVYYFLGTQSGDTISFSGKNRFSFKVEMKLLGMNDSVVWLGRCGDYQDDEKPSGFYQYTIQTKKLSTVIEWDFDLIALTNYGNTKYLDYLNQQVLMGNAVSYDFEIFNLQTQTKERIKKESFQSKVDLSISKQLQRIGKNASLSFAITDRIKQSENHITYVSFIDSKRLFVRYFDSKKKMELIDIWSKVNGQWEIQREGLPDTYYRKPGLGDSVITKTNLSLCTFNYPIFFVDGKLLKIDANAAVYPLGEIFNPYYQRLNQSKSVNKVLVYVYTVK